MGYPSTLQVDFRPKYAAFLRDLIIKGVAAKDNPLFPLVRPLLGALSPGALA